MRRDVDAAAATVRRLAAAFAFEMPIAGLVFSIHRLITTSTHIDDRRVPGSRAITRALKHKFELKARPETSSTDSFFDSAHHLTALQRRVASPSGHWANCWVP